jgi:diguanylate cyclase (GGDEF)-like protein
VQSSHAVGDLGALQAAFAALEQGVTIHDRDGRVVVCNPAAARLIGLPLDEILGERPHYEAVDARFEGGEPITAMNSGVLRALNTGERERDRLVELRASGGGAGRWIRVSYEPLFSTPDEPPWGVSVSFLEVEPYADADATAAIAHEVAPEALLALDAAGVVVHTNQAARALAAEVAELLPALEGKTPLRAILFDRVRYETPTRDDLEDDRPIEIACSFERPAGGVRWLAATFRMGRPDTPVASVCSIRDITRERERADELAHIALHDPLTGLANRRLIDEHLKVALARAHRGELSVGLLFLDLDGFKQINERFGHKGGDAVLVEFAGRLARAVRAADPVGRAADPVSLVSRPGGDEFIVILSDLSPDPGPAIAGVMERVRLALQAPFALGEVETAVSVSIGAAEYPLDGRDAQTLVERANGMMQAAKRAQR